MASFGLIDVSDSDNEPSYEGIGIDRDALEVRTVKFRHFV